MYIRTYIRMCVCVCMCERMCGILRSSTSDGMSEVEVGCAGVQAYACLCVLCVCCVHVNRHLLHTVVQICFLE